MVSLKSVHDQLKRLHFNVRAWGKAEVAELPKILLDDEEIYEAVNGIYEGGFALLVATNFRVLLIDKKPLNYLTVEDLRFDMINEIDYSHRMMGAQIVVSTGSKTMRFRSYNQPRLRKLIGHVQHCMADAKQSQSKHQQGQNDHLEQINQQLQAYLIAQYLSQQELSKQLQQAQLQGAQLPAQPQVIQPNAELSDYLFAQSLLRQHEQQIGAAIPTETTPATTASTAQPLPVAPSTPQNQPASPQLAELYADGMEEVFGKHPVSTPQASSQPMPQASAATGHHSLEINAFRIAYSKLPMALRNRNFSRPIARVTSAAAAPLTATPTQIANSPGA